MDVWVSACVRAGGQLHWDAAVLAGWQQAAERPSHPPTALRPAASTVVAGPHAARQPQAVCGGGHQGQARRDGAAGAGRAGGARLVQAVDAKACLLCWLPWRAGSCVQLCVLPPPSLSVSTHPPARPPGHRLQAGPGAVGGPQPAPARHAPRQLCLCRRPAAPGGPARQPVRCWGKRLRALSGLPPSKPLSPTDPGLHHPHSHLQCLQL